MSPSFDAAPTEKELSSFFPIESQTSETDKLCLLGAMRLVRRSGRYSYAEIGSFRGGSLAPFLMDEACTSILSIDDRGRVQPDSRGVSFNYAGITTQTMLDELHRCGLTTTKLETFDGSISARPTTSPARYDLAFIDGEHTDEACFRDFLWTLPLVKTDSIILFHDSSLVYAALKLILLYLDKDGRKYSFYKRAGSAMSAVLLGSYSGSADTVRELGTEESHQEFFERAEAQWIKVQFRNRARFRFAPRRLLQRRMPIAVDIMGPKTRPAF